MKARARRGLPREERAAAWLSLVDPAAEPPGAAARERVYAATLAQTERTPALDHFGTMLDAERHPEHHEAAGRVLLALDGMLDLQFAPMLTCIAPLLLRQLTEADAFWVLQQLVQGPRKAHFSVIVGYRHYVAAGQVLLEFVQRFRYRKSVAVLERTKALRAELLVPFFASFFGNCLAVEQQLRVVDVYLSEGSKALYRVGLGMFIVHKHQLKQDCGAAGGPGWWDRLAELVAQDSSAAATDRIFSRGFGVRLSRRRIGAALRQAASHPDVAGAALLPPRGGESIPVPAVPLHGPQTGLLSEELPRALLATWLPSVLRVHALQRIYSSETDGRSLERVRALCGDAAPCLLLMEALESGRVVGALLSHSLQPQRISVGDDSCFVFHLDGGAAGTHYPIAAHDPKGVHRPLTVTGDFVAVGWSFEGSEAALRFDGDLERATSQRCDAFANEPLAGREDFTVGAVEVYRFALQ